MATSIDPPKLPASVSVKSDRIFIRSPDVEFELSLTQARMLFAELSAALARVDELALWSDHEVELEKPGPWLASDN